MAVLSPALMTYYALKTIQLTELNVHLISYSVHARTLITSGHLSANSILTPPVFAIF